MSGGRRRDGRRSAGGGRLVRLFVLLVIAFCGMAGRLVTLQIVQAPAYATLAVDQRSRVVEFPARRGAIFDRNGNALAVSVDLDTV
ncbi:MAG: penicillin-binding protein 2, partial [Actinobacteria bacterium]|nr:penicillin-binding protein 2 [Actinomycetota bacterium]